MVGGDRFAAVSKLCRISLSQEADLRKCRFVREPVDETPSAGEVTMDSIGMKVVSPDENSYENINDADTETSGDQHRDADDGHNSELISAKKMEHETNPGEAMKIGASAQVSNLNERLSESSRDEGNNLDKGLELGKCKDSMEKFNPPVENHAAVPFQIQINCKRKRALPSSMSHCEEQAGVSDVAGKDRIPLLQENFNKVPLQDVLRKLAEDCVSCAGFESTSVLEAAKSRGIVFP